MTPEQIAAQAGLVRAMAEHRKAFLDTKPEYQSEAGEVLTDWILISAYVSYDNDGDQTVAYHFAMNNDQQSDHISKGLLQQGIDELREYSWRRAQE